MSKRSIASHKRKLPKYIQYRWSRYHAQAKHPKYGTVHLGTFATLEEALERQEEFKRDLR